MNIYTASIPDFNPDHIIMNRPAPAEPKHDNSESSSFAKLVSSASSKRSVAKSEDKPPVRPEHHRDDKKVETKKMEERPVDTKKADDKKHDKQVSESGKKVTNKEDDKKDSGTEVKQSEGKTKTTQNKETAESASKDADAKVKTEKNGDKQETQSADENNQAAEQTVTSLEQVVLNDVPGTDQSDEQIATAQDNSEETNSSVAETDTENTANNETGKTDIINNINSSSGKTEAQSDEKKSSNIDANADNKKIADKSDEKESANIDANADNNEIADKKEADGSKEAKQGDNDGSKVDNETIPDEAVSGEIQTEDGENEKKAEESRKTSKKSKVAEVAIDELPDELETNEDLNEKIKEFLKKGVPEKYAKKTVAGSGDHKTSQDHTNVIAHNNPEDLNKFRTLQEGMLFNGIHSIGNNGATGSAIQGLTDLNVNSLESLASNNVINNGADLMQNQGLTLAAGRGIGLTHGNAARAAGFAELLSQVVYTAKGKNRLDVSINHEEFGKLKINLSMDKGLLNIHVNASEKVVREFIESNVQNIVESLTKDGVSVGGFSVALKDHKDNPEKRFMMDNGFERNYEIRPAAVHSARGLINVFA